MANKSRSFGGKVLFAGGWLLSGAVVLMFVVTPPLLFFFDRAKIYEGSDKVEFSRSLAPVLVTLEVTCGLVYAFPRTAVLGAVLLTGYLGGAIGSHVRLGQPDWVGGAVVGVVVWLGLFLRDSRVRALLPYRRPGR